MDATTWAVDVASSGVGVDVDDMKELAEVGCDKVEVRGDRSVSQPTIRDPLNISHVMLTNCVSRTDHEVAFLFCPCYCFLTSPPSRLTIAARVPDVVGE